MAKGVLLDLQALPGAAEAIARLRSSGFSVRFLTNTTRTPKHRIIARLQSMELPIAAEEVFTPSQAARAWLSLRQLTPFLVVHPDLVGEFAGLAGMAGEAVVVGDVGETLTYAQLNDAFRHLMGGAEFLALANNRTFKDRDGELSLDAGPFVAALGFASRRQAIVLGKPSAEFFATALASIDCGPEDAVMVGDDAEADVAGALSAGVGRALLVRTGKYCPGDEDRVDPAPTATVADLAEAARWIAENCL